MPILRPKDCHTTNQKYRPRLRFEAIEDTPSALICTVHAFSKKSQKFPRASQWPSDKLEFLFKTSITSASSWEVSQIPYTNKQSSADSEFYAESYALSLTATRPQRHQRSYSILPKSKCNDAGSASSESQEG